MKQSIVKIVSWLMMAVFFLAVAPKEILHEVLFDHKDAVHPAYKRGEMVFTPKHFHCKFMELVMAPYVPSEKQYFVARITTEHFEKYLLHAYHFSYAARHYILSLRGPPEAA